VVVPGHDRHDRECGRVADAEGASCKRPLIGVRVAGDVVPATKPPRPPSLRGSAAPASPPASPSPPPAKSPGYPKPPGAPGNKAVRPLVCGAAVRSRAR
jgi:hypothetical protein